MKLSIRARRLLAVGIVVVGVLIGIPRFLTHTPYARLGVSLDWASSSERVQVDKVIGPPGHGVLETGDVILEVDGESITRDDLIELRLQSRDNVFPREPFGLTVERAGERLTLKLPRLEMSAWERVRLYAVPCVAIVLSPLVALFLVWRRPMISTGWVFLWFAAVQAVGTVYGLFRFPQTEVSGAFRIYLEAYKLLVSFFPAAFLHFMTVFPRARWSLKRRNVWFWLVVAAYLTPPLLFLASSATGRPIEQFYIVFQSIALPLGIVSLVERYLRPGRLDWKPRAGERILALIVGVALLAGTTIDLLSQDPRMIALFAVPLVQRLMYMLIFAWMLAPLVIAYLIANDPSFDPRRVILRSIPYAGLTGVLAAVYLAIVLGGERLFATVTGEESLLFNIVAALVVAFAFAPVRERLQRGLDRLYGRDPQALRLALDGAGRQLLGALDRAEVRKAVEGAIARGMKRPVAIEWPERRMPRIARGEEVGDEERSAIEALLLQAGIRLDNLRLQRERANAERRTVEFREAATRAELRALLAQVQPHFLFNALNALSYLTETDPKAAQRFTERLADMLRYTVEAGSRPAALLSEEIAFVEDYLGVARERYENPMSFKYIGSDELLSVAVPPLLLQPLVENSLKHGCAPGEDALNLALEARCNDGTLTLVFRDNGKSGNNGLPGLGVGLENLEQRVRRFGGKGALMLATPNPSGGFTVTLKWKLDAVAA